MPQAILAAMDLAVFSSQLEGLPNGVLECMAAGLPIIATDIPGIGEAVKSDNLAYLVPSGDAETFAARILESMDTPEEQQRLRGVANREHVRNAFPPIAMCDKRQLPLVMSWALAPPRTLATECVSCFFNLVSQQRLLP